MNEVLKTLYIVLHYVSWFKVLKNKKGTRLFFIAYLVLNKITHKQN